MTELLESDDILLEDMTVEPAYQVGLASLVASNSYFREILNEPSSTPVFLPLGRDVLRAAHVKPGYVVETVSSEDSVAQYLREIGSEPLLSPKEERQLGATIRSGQEARSFTEVNEVASVAVTKAIKDGELAKQRLIRANLRLVVSMARRYPPNRGLGLMDIIQEGNLGLEHATDKFDDRLGWRFSTYATWWIRQYMGRAMNQKSTLVRLPGEKAEELRRLKREYLAANNGSFEGFGDSLEGDLRSAERVSTMTGLDGSSDDSSEGNAALYNVVADSNPGPEEVVTETVFSSDIIDRGFAVLNPRQQQMVVARFGLDGEDQMTYKEIGKQHGITVEAARRAVKKSLDLIRQEVEAS